ncbi:MAG: Holliday junction resolvase RuvX [Candidatus Paceibacterota bacterium]|jgi:putative Holliday junction resolvase
MRLLGIDYGHKKVGLAISDESGRFAFPLAVVINDKSLLKKIKKICEQEKIEIIIIGESLDLSGQPNPIMTKIRKFADELKQETKLPFKYEREFYTSWEAKRIIDESQTDKMTDARAAALILKSYIDQQNNRSDR